MSLTITEGLMQSDLTDHTCMYVDGRWRASWLPDRILDRNQAITAMTIAEEVDRGRPHDVGLIVSLANELGLLGYEAVRMVNAPRSR